MDEINEYVKEQEKKFHDEFKGVQLLYGSPPGMSGKSFYGRLASGFLIPWDDRNEFNNIKINSTPLDHKQMSNPLTIIWTL